MKLYKIRGGSEENLKNRKYSIYLGISLGNKWFTTQNIIGLIKWSLENSLGKVGVVPADDIHAINLEARNRISRQNALIKVHKMSANLIHTVQKEVAISFSKEEQARIEYVTWQDVNTDKYQEKVKWLYSYYERDDKFRETILGIVQGFVSDELRIFSEEKIQKLGTYLIEEFPELIARVPIKGVRYDAYVYPFDGTVTELVEDIQLRGRFPEIKEKIMDTESKVFLEVR